jgi:hypothetical protein
MSAYDRGERGYVLANGTGTGKTYLIQGLIAEGNYQRALVLVPNDPLIIQAAEVAPLFGQKVNKIKGVGETQPNTVSYMTYSGLSRLADTDLANNYDLIVFDESHALKNYYKGDIATANAAVDLMRSNPNAKILFSSATPFQSLPEMKYMEPLGLWTNFSQFLMDHNYTWVQPKSNILPGFWRFDGSTADILDVYKQLTQRGLASWRELKMDSKLSNEFVRVPLRGDVQAAYNQANRLFDAAADSVRDRSLINAQRTIALRRLMEMSKVDDAIKLAKKELAAGRQVAIFVGYRGEARPPQFKSRAYDNANYYLSQVYDLIDSTETKSINKLIDALGGRDNVAEFHGDISPKERTQAKNDYNSGKKKVLVATAAAGGVGLSLHDLKGDAPRSQINIYVPWSGQSFQQVAGRSYRFGSMSDTRQYWLFSDTPKEEAVANVIGTRLKEMHALVNGVAASADNEKIQAFDFGLLDNPAGADKFLGASEKFFQSPRPPAPETPSVGPNPPGAGETIGAPTYEGELQGDLWINKVKPYMDAFQSEITRRGPITGKQDLAPDIKDRLAAYQDMVNGDLATARMTTQRWAENVRDYALLNYSRRTMFDNLLGLVYPYQFWYTRTGMNFLSRAIDKPAWYAMWAKLRNYQNAFHLQGYPSRLDNKIEIPAAWLPEWAGSSMFVDPVRKSFPMEDIFFNPIIAKQQEKTDQQRAAEYILLSWVRSGQITEEQAREAALSQSGEIWDSAMSQASMDQDMTSDVNWLNTIMQPALYLTLPYFMATGKNWVTGRDDMPLLPITRTGLGAEAATKGTPLQAVGDFVGGLLAYPETTIRKKAGLQEFGDWSDYYIDRNLASMAADGTITTREAQKAMITRSGEAYDEARARTKYEIGVSTPGSWPIQAALKQPWKNPLSFLAATLFGWLPAGLLPEGELEQRNLGLIYKQAREAYNKGDPDALQDFFEKHPEYEARLSLYDPPDERLRQFLISEVWDRYNALGSLEKGQVRDQLGDDFTNLFLDKTNRNYNELDSRTLAMWAQQLGGTVPKNETTAPLLADPDFQQSTLDIAPKADADIINTYRDVRNKLYPNWYAMQTWYYSFPKGSQERKDVLKQFPQLKEYWEWNREYKAKYPVIAKYQSDNSNLGAAADYSYLEKLDPITLNQLFAYYTLGQEMTSGAQEELFYIYQQLGEPGGSFDNFLEMTRAGLVP